MSSSAAIGFDILGFGAVAVDDLLYVDHYPLAESKVRVQHRLRQAGGLTGTALVAAARLGCRCAYVGMLGDDELSQFVMESLAREAVDVDHRARRGDARPGHSTIIVDEGNKTRTIFSTIGGPMGADPSHPDGDLIRAAKVLLVDHHGLEGTIRAARIARQAGVGIVADLERDPGEPFPELLALVDHLIISARFAGELTDTDDPGKAARRLLSPDRSVVVVTGGVAGCWYVGGEQGDRPRHHPAYQVDAVDTTGCGDVFHGAYAAALAQGDDLHQRILVASAAAAIKTTQRGGQTGCPTRRQVEMFLADRAD